MRDDTGELRTQGKWEFRSTLVLPLGLQDLGNGIQNVVGCRFVKTGTQRIQACSSITEARAHIIEIEPCAVNVHQDLVRGWIWFRRILRELDFGRVVDLADYESTHTEDREIQRSQVQPSFIQTLYITCLCWSADVRNSANRRPV